LIAVPEEVSTPIEERSRSKITLVSSEDVNSGSDSSQGTLGLGSYISNKLLPDVKRHSSMKCVPTPTSNILSSSPLSHQDRSAEHFDVNNTMSNTERKLPRRTTTRRKKLSRKSTRRVRQHILDANIHEFDDDNCFDADDGEEVEFSETDSEANDNDGASGSDESDLEFETELAKQMNVNQVCYS